MGLHCCYQIRRFTLVSRAAPEEVSAKLVFVLDEEYVGSGLRGGQGGGHARRSATGHQHVRMGIALVVGPVGAGLPVDAAPGGETAENLLVERPQKPGTHECLVVEPGRKEPPDHLVDGAEVEPQAGPHVLGGDRYPV